MQHESQGSGRTDEKVGLLAIAIMPTMLTLFVSVPFIALKMQTHPLTLAIQMIVTMGLSFVFLPFVFTRRLYSASLADIGVRRLHAPQWALVGVSIFALYAWIHFFGQPEDPWLLAYRSIQTLIVAVCEEFWARGLLYYHIRKFVSNGFLVVIATTAIFTFIVHMNRPILENVLYRFPGALVMTLAYWKTKNLAAPITVHFIYNMLSQ